MKYIWGLVIAALVAAISYFSGYWEVGLIPFAFISLSYVASIAGVSGAVIFTVLSLGGRVTIITFMGIVIASAILLGRFWG